MAHSKKTLFKNGDIKAIAYAMGLSPHIVSQRIYHGWTLDRALTEPVHLNKQTRLNVRTNKTQTEMEKENV